MDGFKEKKWFVYLGDHHEGPFSLEEIQTKMSEGQLSSTHYVWAEGMADWKMMKEVQAFEFVMQTRPEQTNLRFSALPETIEFTNSSKTGTIPAIDIPPVTQIEDYNQHPPSSSGSGVVEPFYGEAQLAPEPSTSSVISLASLSSRPSNGAEHGSGMRDIPGSIYLEAATGGPAIMLEPSPASAAVRATRQKKRRFTLTIGKILGWIFPIMILGGIGLAYQSGAFNGLLNSPAGMNLVQSALDVGYQIPYLNTVISPLPQLDDVAPEDFQAMKDAVRASLSAVGPQIAIAMSRNDLSSPTFYFASNLPDGAIFDIYIEGIPETLLSQLSFAAKTQVVITKHFGKAAGIQSLDGKTFPRGQFVLYVVDPGTQSINVQSYTSRLPSVTPTLKPITMPQGVHLIATKTYFAGGPRDATYTTRLKEFHDKLMAKAQAEVAECSQFAALLDSQLTATTGKFEQFKKIKKSSPVQKKSWAQFHQQWSLPMTQLDQTFSRLTAESLKNDYFYGALYEASQQAVQAVEKLHEMQSNFLNSPTDPRSFEIQLGEANSIAQTAVNELKAKIDQIQKLPPNPSGMPIQYNGT